MFVLSSCFFIILISLKGLDTVAVAPDDVSLWSLGSNRTQSSCYHPHLNFLIKIRGWSFIPRRIIDVGASRGSWGCQAWHVFADSMPIVFLVEESESFQKYLRRHPFFYAISPISGPSSAHKSKESSYSAFNIFKNLFPFFGNSSRDRESFSREALSNQSSSEARTLDDLLSLWDRNYGNKVLGSLHMRLSTSPKKSLRSEFDDSSQQLLKISMNGLEIQILEGAKHTLRSVEMIIVEISLISWKQGSILAEIVIYMHSIGFEFFDIPDVHRNIRSGPRRGELLQIDLAFVRNDSRLISQASGQVVGLESREGTVGSIDIIKASSMAARRSRNRRRKSGRKSTRKNYITGLQESAD